MIKVYVAFDEDGFIQEIFLDKEHAESFCERPYIIEEYEVCDSYGRSVDNVGSAFYIKMIEGVVNSFFGGEKAVIYQGNGLWFSLIHGRHITGEELRGLLTSLIETLKFKAVANKCANTEQQD